MGGFLSRINTRLHNALSRSGTTREAPAPSDASIVSRVTNRRDRGSGQLPPPLPRRPPPLPAHPPRQDGSAHDAAGVASLTATPAAPRFTNPSPSVSQDSHATGASANQTTHGIARPPLSRRPPPLQQRRPPQDAPVQNASDIASPTSLESAIHALEIVAERAALTSDNLDHRAETTAAQLQRDVTAFNTHPPYVAHVAALNGLRMAAARLEAAGQGLDAAQARANAHEEGLVGRTMAATFAAEAGQPEALQQIAQETLAVQAAVNGAQQAAIIAVEEYTARNATVQAGAAVHDEMAVAAQALRQRRQDLAQLRGTQQLATDALVDAWTASNAMQKMP